MTQRLDRLPRTLGLGSATALVIGITIGSGIFRSPAGVAQKVGDLAGADSLFAGAIERDPRFAGGWVRRIDVALARQNPGLARVLADSAGARGIALPLELARRLPPAPHGAGEKGN